MRLKRRHHNRAFTLIEIIITLTVTAVLATMIYMYFGKAFSESVTPITRLRTSAALQRVMENIRADYNVYPKWRSGAVYAADALVIPTNFNGHYYKSSGGTSGTTEPNWPLNNGGTTTVPDNTISTWTESGMPWTSDFLENTLSVSIGAEGSEPTNDYGKNPDGLTYTKYTVVKNGFVKFEDGAEQDVGTGEAKNILRVTLMNENKETLTALFFSKEP